MSEVDNSESTGFLEVKDKHNGSYVDLCHVFMIHMFNWYYIIREASILSHRATARRCRQTV